MIRYWKDGDPVCVVCLSESAAKTKPTQIAGLLVHEAVHVWQEYAKDIQETHTAAEQEAYAIQAVAQKLMEEYARRLAA